MFRLTFIVLLTATSLSAAPLEVSISGGVADTRHATIVDRDCGATQPPALFGCGAGNDGRSIAARGDFGRSPLLELALGTALTSRVRVALGIASRAPLDFRGEANFVGVAGRQPVETRARALSTIIRVTLDPGPQSWRIRPLLTAGVGASSNSTGPITYRFPSITGGDATTTTRGGHVACPLWTAGAGATIPVFPSLSIDLTLAHTDLGHIRTEPGQAEIVRPRGVVLLAIAGTQARLCTNELTIGLRYRTR